MDYHDYQEGMTENHFWLRGKVGLIGILLERCCPHKKLKILNIGAGTGNDLSTIGKFGEVSALDISAEALKKIDDRLVREKILGDVCHMPHGDEQYDLVVAFDVLEHIKDDSCAIREIARVLKPNGVFIFTVPAFQSIYHRHDKQLGHFRRYSKKTLRKLIEHSFSYDLGYWCCCLFLPVAMYRLITRYGWFEMRSQQKDFCGRINTLFLRVLERENSMIAKQKKLPFGLSLYGICYKR